MRYYFFDTSALVKVYAEEWGSGRVRDLLRSARKEPQEVAIIICDIALPEAVSALVRKADERAGAVVPANLGRIIEKLAGDVRGPACPYVVVEASGVMEAAASAARGHRLKGADAIQLAAGLAARANSPPGVDFYFATADEHLENAARAEGFQLFEEILRTPAR